uniref:REP element-mobilizing transposase RayT n=1 Tax=Candidatus Kentrum sp. LPFa TaxID=2126335 RepID=A0A450X2T1_9GAMM|nr:MAG: REP element-mobilizing transposase RayT [Candidatus Kentron sp. LPFa]VFK35468.1 MAG: REP element-mobilizing transposase RayT [Candidatus Kentron sp. LPFa]
MRGTIDPGNRALRLGRSSLPHQIYLVTTVTVERQPVFLDFHAGCAAARCFGDRAILRDTHMLSWVLMPDHAHWLIQLGEKDSLSGVANRLKSASARLVNRALGKRGALWQRSFYDHALRSEEDLRKIARYIVANPVRAGLVERVGGYPFWDAVWM